MAIFTVGVDAAYCVDGDPAGATEKYANYEAENAEHAKKKAITALRKTIADDEGVTVNQIRLFDIQVSVREVRR